MGLTVGATHPNLELAAAGLIESVESKNFSTDGTAGILFSSWRAKVISNDLVPVFFGIMGYFGTHNRPTC
jgi:hypothetical protein